MRRFWPLLILAAALVGCAASGTVDDEGEPLDFPDAGVPKEDDPETPTSDDDVEQPAEDCPIGFVEDGGFCLVDKAARWDVVVLDARFDATDPDGDDWDLNGGNPDGYVWIEFGSSPFEVETDPDPEKLNPAWNQTLIWGVSAAELRSHFELRLYDFDKYDISGDDLQAGCVLNLPDDVFGQNQFRAEDLDPACPDVSLAVRLVK